MARRDKSCTEDTPTLPPVNGNGWVIKNETFAPVMCLALPVPNVVIELTKFGCKKGCHGKCSCRRTGLPCTPLCKCSEHDCYTAICNGTRCGVEAEGDSEEESYPIKCLLVVNCYNLSSMFEA